MFTSRPSDPRTVLLWGDRWHFPDGKPSDPFQHVIEAAEILAARYADEPKPMRLRLVYQPDAFESVTAACPHGDRRTLALALGAEHPSLVEPGRAWGHEPVLQLGDGYSTVLHYETEPALVALVGQLARNGLAVHSAWPLLTFLYALPPEWSDSGGTTVLAVRAGAALAYHHPRDGARTALGWRGDTALIEAAGWLRGHLAESKADPVLVTCPDDGTIDTFRSQLGDADLAGVEFVRLSDAIGQRVTLPRYHPAQLLTREPVVTAQRCAVAASIALLLAAGWAGASYARGRADVRAEITAREARHAALKAEVNHLRANADEIAALKSLVEGGAGGPPVGELLRRLSANAHPGIVLESIKVNGQKIELAGWVDPSAPAQLLEQWRQAVTASQAKWSIDLQAAGTGAFTAAGAFTL